jgi:hypothetical protein
VQSEAVVKVLAGDLVDDETVARSIVAMREDIAEVAERLAEAEANIPNLPHRARYLRLVHALGRRLLEAHRDWVDEVEETLSHDGGQAPPTR